MFTGSGQHPMKPVVRTQRSRQEVIVGAGPLPAQSRMTANKELVLDVNQIEDVTASVARHRSDAEAREPVESDESVVDRVKQGQRDAYRLIVERYERSLRALAFDIVRNRADAEEVVQETLVKAFLALERFRGESSFKTFLFRIAYNMAIDVRRKLSRHGVVAASANDGWEETATTHDAAVIPGFGSYADAQDPGRTLLEKESLEQVRDALGTMSDEHRQVMMLREVEGMSYNEIADVTGVTLGTVMSRLHYARKRLLALVRRDGGGSDQTSGKA